jgi:methionyl-tRNA synthetase
MAASAPEWSQKLLEFKVDFGSEIGEKTILSGIKQWYQPEEFVGKLYVFVINLAERKMGEGVSQGMMIMGDSPEGKGLPFSLPDELVPGMVIR